MVDDLEELLTAVLWKIAMGYRPESLQVIERDQDGNTRWGVLMVKDGRDLQRAFPSSEMFLPYTREDMESGLREAVEELRKVLELSRQGCLALEDVIPKLANYHAQTIRVSRLLRLLRAAARTRGL